MPTSNLMNIKPEESLVWNHDLTLADYNAATQKRQEAVRLASVNRPKTARLEREIMVAVIGLYLIILGGFALLHVYGAWWLDQEEARQAEAAAAKAHGAVDAPAVDAAARAAEADKAGE